MRINRNGGLISLRDRPAPFWGLGLFLLAGGVLAIAAPPGLATNAGDLELWERLASIAVGSAVCAAALWWLHQNPASSVQLDLTHQRLRLVRIGLGVRQLVTLAFNDLAGVEVEEGADSEGGKIWRPAVRLRTGQLLVLSALWSHDEKGIEQIVKIVANACRLSAFPLNYQHE